MLRKVDRYLYDIKESIESIEEFLGENRDFSAYQKNKLLKRAIERELEIIGEATNQILKIQPDIQVTHARRIVDLRNWIIHGYEKVGMDCYSGIGSVKYCESQPGDYDTCL